jgi:NTE family protein
MSTSAHDLALVLSGGGARAAYQVGVLAAIAERAPELRIPVVTGVSAGAINAAYLAAHQGTLRAAVSGLSKEWMRLTADQVYRLRPVAPLRWALGSTARLLGWGRNGAAVVRGLFDMRPLTEFLTRAVDFGGIQRNIETGRLRAVALSATSYASGRMVTFLDGASGVPVWEHSDGAARRTRLTVDHVMASSALPLVFPAVRLEGEFFGDGSVRQTAPLAPPIRLGARRILAIAMQAEGPRATAAASALNYPPAAQVLALLFHSVFLDALDADAERLQVVNQLLAAVPCDVGARVSRHHVELLLVRPSRDLATLCSACRPELPPPFQWLVRAIGGERSADFLSYLMFEPAYTSLLIELGHDDAAAQWPRIERLLEWRPARCAA